MPQNWKKIAYRDYEIPAIPEEAYGAFTAIQGKIIVEMCEPPESRGRILLPDRVVAQERPDVGVVLACKKPDSWRKEGSFQKFDLPDEAVLFDIAPGDVVMVRPDDGDWMMGGFESGTYSTEREIRLYGIAGEPSVYQATHGRQGDPKDNGLYNLIWWSESVVAKVVGDKIVPTHENLMVRPIRKNPYTLWVDEKKLPTTECVVEAVSRHSRFKRGQVLSYLPDNDFDLSLGDDDLYIVRESQVQAYILAEAM